MECYYTVFDTRFGWVAIAGSQAGLRRLTLPQETPDKALKLIADLVPQSAAKASDFSEVIFQLQRYFEGKKVDFSEKLDLQSATPFQQEVWRLTRSIPHGETRTYGWVAAKLGRPKSARGVGQALARNPLPIIIPCHRVVGFGKSLGGFTGGLEMKSNLLKLELLSHHSL